MSIEWNRVTWYSNVSAVVVFLMTFAIAFVLGVKWEQKQIGESLSSVPAPTGTGGGIAPYTSGVRGMVLLGPICPVLRDPPDPGCADKGYATTVSVSRVGSSKVFATTKSDAQGAFEFSLPPGAYTVTAEGGEMLPHCNPTEVTVGPTGYVPADISCDTGIR